MSIAIGDGCPLYKSDRLSAGSVEERMARESIIEGRPGVLPVILDAVWPERNLDLVAELLSLPVPLTDDGRLRV